MDKTTNLSLKLDELRQARDYPRAFSGILSQFPEKYYEDLYFATVIGYRDIIVAKPKVKDGSVFVTMASSNPDHEGNIRKVEVNIALQENLRNEVVENIISTIEANIIREKEAVRQEAESGRIRRILDEAETRKLEKEI